MIQLNGIPPGKQPLVIGVSGGPDSLCLLSLLRQEQASRLIVACFNHKLRSEADAEVEFVRELAVGWGLEFATEAGDALAYAKKESLSLEEAARRLRYHFLFKIARKNQADGVLVGHNADDQVETILMHFIRGSGVSGLCGMRSAIILEEFDPKIPLVRPLLNVWRTEIEAYCEIEALHPIQDASNRDVAFFRNRLRHSLLPELETYNPNLKKTLLRTTRVMQGDLDMINNSIHQAWNSLKVQQGNGWIAFDRCEMIDLPDGVLYNLIRKASGIIMPENRDIGFDSIDRALDFIRSKVTGRMDFAGGLFLFGEENSIFLASNSVILPSYQWPQVEEECRLDFSMVDLGHGWELSKQVRQFKGQDRGENSKLSSLEIEPALNLGRWSAWLDASVVGADLHVRAYRSGDRFLPLGMHGQSAALQDYFINQKIPRRARKKWPLVCSGNEIVWIPGYQISHTYRVTEHTEQVVCLHMEKK